MGEEIIQGTAAWHALRLGRVTASRVADVIAKTKTGVSASRANYLAELVAERLTGEPGEFFTARAAVCHAQLRAGLGRQHHTANRSAACTERRRIHTSDPSPAQPARRHSGRHRHGALG